MEMRENTMTKTTRILRWIYFAAGFAAIGYYFLLGKVSRFGLSISWIWLLIGCFFILGGIGCRLKVPRGLRVQWRCVVAAALIVLGVLEGLVVSGMHQTAPANLDYIIVLGARVESDGPSPALNRRLNAAMDYLKDNPDTMVIASGGQGRDEPMSEAACIRDELVRRGIAPERILLEDQSTDTSENIRYSMALIEDHAAQVGVVTNNFHVYRAQKLARGAGLVNAHGIAAQYTGYTLLHYMVREAICIMVDGLRGNF